MKKSMIMMCISAMLGLCIPAIAGEPTHTPPVKTEIKLDTKSEAPKSEENTTPGVTTPVNNENGDESTSANSAHSGYIVISGAGLLLLIILLIILL